MESLGGHDSGLDQASDLKASFTYKCQHARPQTTSFGCRVPVANVAEASIS